jgi:5'-nucleotidase/UDP-sugar diphosphatase
VNNKRWSYIILSVTLALTLFVASCKTGSTPIPSTPTLTPRSEPYELTILHTSENHGHWDPVEVSKISQGGIARRATLVKKVRAEVANTLLLDSGDISQGTLYFTQYRGSEGRDLYNLLGYDAVVTGNHEYDVGPKLLADNFLNGAQFSVVVANIDFSGEPLLAGKIPPFVIKTVGGKKVGIFGLVTDEVTITSSPGPNVIMKDTTQSAREAVAELSRQGVNKIILLSHLGFPSDQDLAARVPGIDVIVSGHTDTLMGDPTKLDPSLGEPDYPFPVVVNAPDGSQTLIVHAFTWGRLVGRLNLVFNSYGEIQSWNGEPIFIDENITDDFEVTQKLAELAKPLGGLTKQVIGSTTINLDGRRTTVRNQESNLGNMVADAMLWSTRQDKTEIAIANGGGIRASIDSGNISYSQVLEVLPFGNRLVQVDLIGAEILAALENGVSEIKANPEESGGRFPQVAGIKFSADLTKPVGSRVTEVLIGNATSGYIPLDKAAVYRLVTLDFIFGGGDGYTMFKNGQNVRGRDVPQEMAVIDYIKAHSPVSPKVEGRTTLIN